MSDVRVFEYSSLPSNGNAPVFPGEHLARQNATAGATTTEQKLTFSSSTTSVHIQADVAIKVAFGAAPTADANSMLIAAGGEKTFIVAGSGSKVSIYAV
jgi:hypothetical protein